MSALLTFCNRKGYSNECKVYLNIGDFIKKILQISDIYLIALQNV